MAGEVPRLRSDCGEADENFVLRRGCNFSRRNSVLLASPERTIQKHGTGGCEPKLSMRKRIITPTAETIRSRAEGWLDVKRAAIVEITSEDKDYPVESAFGSGGTRGWRAAESGGQTIRLVFDQPRQLKRISLVFEEKESARTQEFVLRWSSDGNSFLEIVRQQWTFSPPQTMREVEEYQVDLSGVTVLELAVVPSINGGAARASLMSLRLS